MKLYATVTSERASKGQGGSKQVEILLQIDPKLRLEVGRVVMTCEGDKYEIYYYPINENCAEQKLKGGRVLLYETKGEKEKGVCVLCGLPHDRTDGANVHEKCSSNIPF